MLGKVTLSRRAAGRDLDGRRERFTDSQISNARRLMDAGQPATQVVRDLGMSQATLYRRISEIQARDWLAAQA